MKTYLSPDEIFLDSSNLPEFNTQQLEGRLERPISRKALYFFGLVFGLVCLAFTVQAGRLEINQGATFAERSKNNTLRQITVFAERGVVYDRNGEELAWNDPGRVYRPGEATAHVLGYVSYPNQKELETGYHPQDFIGRAGVENIYNEWLAGTPGKKIEEVNVHGEIYSDHLYQEPENGEDLTLSLDVRLQEKLFDLIKTTVHERGFHGGAGIIMDVETGELVSLTSYPAYDPSIMSTGKDAAKIKEYLTTPNKPFLNRAAAGLYPPGSTIKPIMALGALSEGIITPEKEILSTGALILPNPYNPDLPSVFKDWKAHGWVNMRRALAISSDVYFYQIGGGFESQKGLGIQNINKYAKLFHLAEATGFPLEGNDPGVIPSPEWKEKVFGEPWRVGNTYHTAIGQYGFQITPLQLVRAIGAIATSGKLVTPTLAKGGGLSNKSEQINLDPADFQIVKDGMRAAVTEGTASGLSIPQVQIAAKTGTAEIGSTKKETNSWITGFFPYQKPRYAFVVLLERGPSTNLIGGVFVMRQFLDWLKVEAPEYIRLTQGPQI